jgi:hypothetical protein
MPDRVLSIGAAQATEMIATSATRQTRAMDKVTATVEYSDASHFKCSLQCMQCLDSQRHLRCSAAARVLGAMLRARMFILSHILVLIPLCIGLLLKFEHRVFG